MATIVKEQVKETKQMDVYLIHEELVLKRKPVTESRRTDKKPDETRTEIKMPVKKEEIESTKKTYVKEGMIAKKKPVTGTKTSED